MTDEEIEPDFTAAEEWLRSDYAKNVLSLPPDQAKAMMFEVFRAGFRACQEKMNKQLSKFNWDGTAWTLRPEHLDRVLSDSQEVGK